MAPLDSGNSLLKIINRLENTMPRNSLIFTEKKGIMCFLLEINIIKSQILKFFLIYLLEISVHSPSSRQ